MAFARALLADPRLLILDEATANIDTRTEQAIQRALGTLLAGRTSIVIAHRLSTIRNADLILVIEAGRIAERGTHDELMAAGGVYADLHRHQFRAPPVAGAGARHRGPMSDARPRASALRWLWPGALLAASLGLWWALSVVPFIPTNDGPQHVMMGHIENHYDDEGAIYRHFLAPAPQYAGRGFAALFVPLESVMPWRAALRLSLFIILLGWSLGFAALVTAIEPRRRWLALVGFATAFQWALYMGFFAFVTGTACGFFLIALALRTTEWSWKRLLILSLGLLLQGFLHVFSALLTAAVMALLALRQARLRQWPGVAAACAPLGILFAFTLGDHGRAIEIQYAETTIWVPLVEKLALLHRCFVPGEDYRGLILFALAATGLMGMLLLARSDRRQLLLGAVSVALFIAALSGPATLPGWQFFFQRFLPLGAMLAVALIPLERLPRIAGMVVAAGLAAYCAVSFVSAASIHRKLYDRSADVLSGLDQPIRRTGLRLPIVRDPWFALPPSKNPIPGMVPLHSIGGLFVAEQGGMIPYMFIDSPSVHEFVARDAAWESDMPVRPPPDLLQQVAHDPPGSPRRLATLDDLALAGTGYQDILLISAPADADAFRRRGYVTDYQKGELFMAHYRGCDVEVSLPAIAGLDAVEYGWWPRLDASKRERVEGIAPAADGRLHVPLPGAPCGPVWLRLSPSAATCQGADAEGRLRTEAPPGRPHSIRCDL